MTFKEKFICLMYEMSMFKAKNKKPFIGDNRVTLDAKHNEMMRHFKDQQRSIPSKEKELVSLRKKYEELEKIPKKNLTNDQLNEKFFLADSISKLENEIEKIELGEEECEYFLQTGHLLYKYYDNIQSIATSDKNNNNYNDNIINTEDKENIGQNDIIDKEHKNDDKQIGSVVDFFSTNEENIISENSSDTKKNTKKKNSTSIKKMSDYVTTKENFQRADILDNYLKIVDSAYVGNINFDDKYDKCSVCNLEKTLVQGEGIMVCENCGETDFIVIDSDRPSYKDPQLLFIILGDEKQSAIVMWIYNR